MTTTTPQFADYEPPAQEDSDTFKPKENYDKPLLVKVREHKTGVVTEFSPDGGEAVTVDLVDLSNGEIKRNVLWMGGAIVDGLKQHAGKPSVLVIRFEKRKSNSGRSYPSPAKGTDADKALAGKYYDKHGDPFAQAFADPSEPESEAKGGFSDDPPF